MDGHPERSVAESKDPAEVTLSLPLRDGKTGLAD
jgi:hypothetical protein